jgi:hypothetical protein
MDNTDDRYLLCVDDGITLNKNNIFKTTAGSVEDTPCAYVDGNLDFQNIQSFSQDIMNIVIASTATSMSANVLPVLGNPRTGGIWGAATAILTKTKTECAPPSPPLPVTFVSTEAAMDENGDVNVEWSTSSEMNNDKFVVERSDNGVNFVEAGEVSDVAGDSKAIKKYSFKDEQPSGEGDNFYYRIRQVDKDGTASFTRIMAVKNDPISKVVIENPQRHGSEVKVDIVSKKDKKVTVKLTNMNGQTVSESKQNLTKTTNSINLKAPPASGMYLIIIDSNDGTKPRTEKLLVQ